MAGRSGPKEQRGVDASGPDLGPDPLGLRFVFIYFFGLTKAGIFNRLRKVTINQGHRMETVAKACLH